MLKILAIVFSAALLPGCAGLSDLFGFSEFDAETLLEKKTFICTSKSASKIVQVYGDPKLLGAYRVMCPNGSSTSKPSTLE